MAMYKKVTYNEGTEVARKRTRRSGSSASLPSECQVPAHVPSQLVTGCHSSRRRWVGLGRKRVERTNHGGDTRETVNRETDVDSGASGHKDLVGVHRGARASLGEADS